METQKIDNFNANYAKFTFLLDMFSHAESLSPKSVEGAYHILSDFDSSLTDIIQSKAP